MGLKFVNSINRGLNFPTQMSGEKIWEMWEGKRGIALFIGDRPGHWNDTNNQNMPRGTFLEKQNNATSKPPRSRHVSTFGSFKFRLP